MAGNGHRFFRHFSDCRTKPRKQPRAKPRAEPGSRSNRMPAALGDSDRAWTVPVWLAGDGASVCLNHRQYVQHFWTGATNLCAADNPGNVRRVGTGHRAPVLALVPPVVNPAHDPKGRPKNGTSL